MSDAPALAWPEISQITEHLFQKLCTPRGSIGCAHWHWMADCCFRKSTVADGGSHLRRVNHAFATAMPNDQRPPCSVAHRDGICNFNLKFGGRVPSVRSTHDLSCAARTRAITLNLQRVSPWRPASGLDGFRLALCCRRSWTKTD